MPKTSLAPALFLIGALALAAGAQKPYGYKSADAGQIANRGGEPMIMPATFLREFDAVTILYDRDMHPGGGPLDNPDAFVTLKPSHPGEYRWLDPRTLEFRPTVPWKPMQSYSVKAAGASKTLTALLSPPLSISPASGSEGLAPFSRIELEFSQPVAPEILARLVTFEVSPLPGVDGKDAKVYGASDYRIKPSEKSGNGSALYGFVLKRPFPNGRRVRTIVRLAADTSLAEAKRVYFADTRKEFAIERAGTQEYQFTLNPAGSAYGRDQAVRLSRNGEVVIDFSAYPASLTLSQVKSLVNFSPAPRDMRWSLSGRRLTLALTVDQERMYNVVIAPADIADADGRKLKLGRKASFYCYQPLDEQYARWGLGQAQVERYGPQHFPLLSSGVKSLDVRVYKIDPLHKAFWPFPNAPVRVDESGPPPGPGEEPGPQEEIVNPLGAWEMVRHISMLGSPPWSAVIDLDKAGVSRFKSLDLKPIFASISGAEKPGTYLVGFRPLDGSKERSYVRIQATDLSLSTVESKRQLMFAVTSLATGRPVSDAEVLIEALKGNAYATLLKGRTDGQGMLVVEHTDAQWASFKESLVKRVTVRRDGDVLVLDSRLREAPPEFANNHWRRDGSTWLDWLSTQPYDLARDNVSAGFVFTERPIYRPDETIYFKGFARILDRGGIRGPDRAGRYLAQIESPMGVKFEFPATLSELGGFNDSLAEKDLPTGEYRLQLIRSHPTEGQSVLASTTFAVEAYRLPKFEVRLAGPDRTPNDKPVSVRLSASYYAGGKVSGQNVAWKVVSYPFSYAPAGAAGFILSTDGRYGAVEEDTQQGASEQKDITDENGQSVLAVNPQAATGGNPRKYVCEATVTDVDEQTVSNRLSFLSLPPFVLGLKVERHVSGTSAIKAEIAAFGIDGKMEAGHKVSVQLKKMSWIAYLQETDFSRGQPKYRTRESIGLIAEKSVASGAAPVTVEFPGQEAGVFVIEIASRDRLGRLQSVSADLFLEGAKPVSWKKGDQLRFETVADKLRYRPGQEARILLKSPFQKALALAVIERPSSIPEYRWIEVAGGQGVLTLGITAQMAPRIPISFLLMRPRIGDEKRTPDGTTADPGRPQTVANTTWLDVEQTENILKVDLAHAGTVRPGSTLEMTVSLKDAQGSPRKGEVALWLVDEAVLSLAKEKPLDPLSAFTAEVRSHISLRDGRNMAMGDLRLSDNPGGDGEDGDGADGGMFGKMTVRKNFRTVPYWNPSILVGKSGTAKVSIGMSDDLTNFSVRAVAVSGDDRFGAGKSTVRARLPLIVQPALPRFVRPGDSFRAGGVVRVVEGPAGAAEYTIEAQGLAIADAKGSRSITLKAGAPLPLKAGLSVPDPGFDAEGNLRYDSVTVRMAVERRADKASDAFSVRLPLKSDRALEEERFLAEIRDGKPLVLPPLPGKARAGTLSRRLVVSGEPGILQAVGAMTSLVRYPHGCTEQMISKTLPALLYRDVWAGYGLEAPVPNVKKYVATTLETLARSQAPDGLFGYWPGSAGHVYLTAYAVELLAEIKRANESAKAGYAFDEAMYRKALDALKRGLRSDYSGFVDGYAYHERSTALLALAKAGELDIGYARELAARANEADVQSQSAIYRALMKNPSALKSESAELFDRLWKRTVFKLDGGKEAFAGLQSQSFRIGERVHADETTALAGMIAAFAAAPKRPDKLPMLVGGLLDLGRGGDWGSTQANGLSLMALRDYLSVPADRGRIAGTFTCGGAPEKIDLDTRKGALARVCADAGKAEFRLEPGSKPVQALFSQRYVPVQPGSLAPASQKGFVVKREFIFIDAAGGNRRIALDSAGGRFEMQPGDILEEHIRVENPKDRFYVAVSAPFAAGLEYMNPRLETSGEDAKPAGATTHPGDYQAFLDDRLVFYFERMAAGTYDFFFRLRSTVEGEFSHPSARAEMMYEMGVYGNSPGAKVVVGPPR